MVGKVELALNIIFFSFIFEKKHRKAKVTKRYPINIVRRIPVGTVALGIFTTAYPIWPFRTRPNRIAQGAEQAAIQFK